MSNLTPACETRHSTTSREEDDEIPVLFLNLELVMTKIILTQQTLSLQACKCIFANLQTALDSAHGKMQYALGDAQAKNTSLASL